jgi:4-diphosphocytidyl-2-C-methyl-D-erythritol kinase
MTITYDAFAKVNLYLHVCAKRENGYHELDSLIVFAETGDRIEVSAASDLTLTITGPLASKLCNEPDNLVIRAARKLQNLCGVTYGAKIILDKHLPIAAGIGGGSGDAAATLKALCELWDISPQEDDLNELALSLGADVPICLTGRAAHVAGIGEIITPIAIPECWIVLVNPGVGVSTPSVFKAREGGFTLSAPMRGGHDFKGFVQALKERRNDLMKPAITLAPVIEDVLKVLRAQKGCALARMSGSGATCFALFENETEALAAEKIIEINHSNWWVSAGKLIC